MESDIIKIWYGEDSDPVEYDAVYDEGDDWVYSFVATNDEDDVIYPSTKWVNEQSCETPFTVNTEETFKIYIDENESIYDTATALLVNEEEETDYPDDDMGFGELPDNLDSLDTLELDNPVDVVVTKDEPVTTFKFKPTKDGFYVFESFSENPAVDPQGRVRTEADLIAEMDDVDEEGNNLLLFKIIFRAQAGETYYLQAKVYEDEENDPYPATFQVKAYDYGADWYADVDYGDGDQENIYNGEEPVTLKVKVIGNGEGLTFNWYRDNGQLLKQNGTNEQNVSEGGDFYCIVSDGTHNVKVNFSVDIPNAEQNNLSFEMIDADTCSVSALWDENEGRMVKGSLSLPSKVSGFIDGRTRTLTEIYRFGDAFELTSVAIPSTVRIIREDAFCNTGLKSITVPASVTQIDEHALGYNLNYSDAGAHYTKVTGFTIFGKTGSAAQMYAKDNGFTFRDPEAEAAAAKAKAAAAAAAKAKEAARQGTPDKKIAKVKISKPAAAKKAVTAKWKKLSSKQIKKGKVKKYEIWVCPNKAFGPSDTIMKEVSKSKSSGKVKVPKKGTYFVKVRAIRKVGGVKYVGKWSSPKKVKVKK